MALTKVVGALQDKNVKVGSFTRDRTAASGSQSVTGVGFQPKAVIFLGGTSGTASVCMGFADATTEGYAEDYIAGSGGFLQSSFIHRTSASDFQTFDLTSLDADGFTVAWTKTANPSAGTITVYYLALA